MEKAKHWFSDAWKNYFSAVNLTEQTAFEQGTLKHCAKISGTYEESTCEFNPHTHLCTQYREAVVRLPPEIQKLEGEYREWRQQFLAAPRKPSFRYPSSRRLPMPKVFGAGFHEIDFDRSIVRLRLDDMADGEWIEFGFKPWPRDYRPTKRDVQVSSVHVAFHGNRMRAGFRFATNPLPSRFAVSQDELDDLRSKQFPRQAQDRQFLAAARTRLVDSFGGVPERDLRVLAVDLGEKGAGAVVYRGRIHEIDVPLRIVKIDRLYDGVPMVLEADRTKNPPPRFDDKSDPRGVRKEHVGRLLLQLQQGAAKIAKMRSSADGMPITLRNSDFRGITRHIRWMIRDWARHNAAQIVAAADQHQCDLIVFESLRGFRPRGYEQMDIAQKSRLAFFAYGRVRRKVVEKAVERGRRVVTVPYGYSSQLCSGCAHLQENAGRLRKNKAVHQFVCECAEANKPGAQPKATCDSASPAGCPCRLRLHSDLNAARVLARVFWGEIELPERNWKKRELPIASAPHSQ